MTEFGLRVHSSFGDLNPKEKGSTTKRQISLSRSVGICTQHCYRLMKSKFKAHVKAFAWIIFQFVPVTVCLRYLDFGFLE